MWHDILHCLLKKTIFATVSPCFRLTVLEYYISEPTITHKEQLFEDEQFTAKYKLVAICRISPWVNYVGGDL